MPSVAIKQVIDPRRASTFGFANIGSNEKERVEFYSGFVGINFRGDGDSVHREDFESFLPVDAGFHVLSYERGMEIDTTVMCTPCSVAGDDDETNVAAVDTAEVRLQPQSIAGVGGDPLCLILRFTAAALNTTLHSVAYHVTVIHRLPRGSETGDGETLQLPGNQRPS